MRSDRANDVDVVVIGGGLSGLVSAGLLAQRGLRVHLIERAEQPGGRGRSREREGFHFDIGAHALYRGGPAMAALNRLGVRLTGKLPRSSHGLAFADGRTYTFPATTRSTLTTQLLSLRGKLGLARFFAGLSRAPGAELAGLSVMQWLEREIDDAGLRRLAAAIIGLGSYCRDLERMSADAGRAQLKLAFEGVLYLDRGWGQIVAGVEQRLRELGVTMQLGRSVGAIERVAERWKVHTDAGEHRSSAVIVATPPSSAAKLLRSAGVEPRWPELVPVQAAALDLGLRGPWTAPDFVLDLDDPIYMTSQSVVSRRAPQGDSTVSLIWYRRAIDADTPGSELRTRLEALLERFVPDFRARTVVEQFLPDITVTFDRPRPELGGLAGRVAVEPEPERAPGLALIGDWIGDRGLLLDAALASAAAATDRVATSYSNSRRRAS